MANPHKPSVMSGAQGGSPTGVLVPVSPQGWPRAKLTRGLCILGLLDALPTAGTCPLNALPFPVLLSLNSPTALLTGPFLLAPLNYAHLYLCLTFSTRPRIP